MKLSGLIFLLVIYLLLLTSFLVVWWFKELCVYELLRRTQHCCAYSMCQRGAVFIFYLLKSYRALIELRHISSRCRVLLSPFNSISSTGCRSMMICLCIHGTNVGSGTICMCSTISWDAWGSNCMHVTAYVGFSFHNFAHIRSVSDMVVETIMESFTLCDHNLSEFLIGQNSFI